MVVVHPHVLSLSPLIVLFVETSGAHPSADAAEDKPAALNGLQAATGDDVVNAVGAGKEKPPSYTEVLGDSEEGASDANLVDDTRDEPVGPAYQPSVLDAEVEPVSDQVLEPVVTVKSVAEQASEAAVNILPTPGAKPETDLTEPVADVVATQVSEAAADIETEKGLAATEGEDLTPVAVDKVGFVETSTVLSYSGVSELQIDEFSWSFVFYLL